MTEKIILTFDFCDDHCLSEEVDGGDSGKEAAGEIGAGSQAKTFTFLELHDAVVGSVADEVEQEDGEEIVGSARVLTGDREVEAKRHVGEEEHHHHYQSGFFLVGNIFPFHK